LIPPPHSDFFLSPAITRKGGRLLFRLPDSVAFVSASSTNCSVDILNPVHFSPNDTDVLNTTTHGNSTLQCLAAVLNLTAECFLNDTAEWCLNATRNDCSPEELNATLTCANDCLIDTSDCTAVCLSAALTCTTECLNGTLDCAAECLTALECSTECLTTLDCTTACLNTTLDNRPIEEMNATLACESGCLNATANCTAECLSMAINCTTECLNSTANCTTECLAALGCTDECLTVLNCTAECRNATLNGTAEGAPAIPAPPQCELLRADQIPERVTFSADQIAFVC